MLEYYTKCLDYNMSDKIIFSGVQPSGEIHIGNYLGAIIQFVNYQTDYKSIFSIVDLHAITVWQEPEALKSSTREVLAIFLASGLDESRNIIFNQSQVPEHTQLAWILSCTARVGWLNRMTQFKDKAGKNRENASIGLYTYPILMAADILLYSASHVPVGEDQKQHLELTRDIAAKFNNDFDVDFFPITEPVIEGAATRVMSLRDGSKKMSKSDPSDLSRLNMTDDADALAKKIRKAKTDAEPLPDSIEGLEGRPEARNLVNIYAALSDSNAEAVITEFSGHQFGTFKPRLVDLAIEKLAPISNEMSRLMQDTSEIDKILARGAERGRTIAAPILAKTYDIVGMLR